MQHVDGLVLASGSPRRKELLDQIGITFTVVPADVDETPLPGEEPLALVRRLAVAKADAVEGDLVLAADTVVAIDDLILGKPTDADDARAMLRRLSARTHEVHTGVAVRTAAGTFVETATTHVTLVPLDDATIDWYLATGEPFDKAGGYGMQGIAGMFVESVHGSASNVIGLPLTVVVRLLSTHAGWMPGATPGSASGATA